MGSKPCLGTYSKPRTGGIDRDAHSSAVCVKNTIEATMGWRMNAVTHQLDHAKVQLAGAHAHEAQTDACVYARVVT